MSAINENRHETEPADLHDTREALSLYEQYGRPLEKSHRGKYLAVSPEGKTLLGSDLLSLTKQAKKAFGPGNVVFKIGEIAVGSWL